MWPVGPCWAHCRSTHQSGHWALCKRTPRFLSQFCSQCISFWGEWRGHTYDASNWHCEESERETLLCRHVLLVPHNNWASREREMVPELLNKLSSGQSAYTTCWSGGEDFPKYQRWGVLSHTFCLLVEEWLGQRYSYPIIAWNKGRPKGKPTESAC